MMSNVKTVFGLLVFIAFVSFMFVALADSDITSKDYTQCVPSISNLGGLLTIATAEGGCGPSPWIGLIIIIPAIIVLAIYILPFVGD